MEKNHPIEGLMITAMNSIQDMIDVNTIIGEPIELNNSSIIPISKVSFGFAAGGSEFKGETLEEYTKREKEEQIQYKLPFGGGAGAGVTINPVAFLVVQEGTIKLLPIEHVSCTDKILDYIPDIIEKASAMIGKCIDNKSQKTQNIINHIQKIRNNKCTSSENENTKENKFTSPKFQATDNLNENDEKEEIQNNATESDGEEL